MVGLEDDEDHMGEINNNRNIHLLALSPQQSIFEHHIFTAARLLECAMISVSSGEEVEEEEDEKDRIMSRR